jgi:hypothetical protein
VRGYWRRTTTAMLLAPLARLVRDKRCSRSSASLKITIQPQVIDCDARVDHGSGQWYGSFGIFDTFADEVVREAHLNEERNGNCRLMASFAMKLSEAALIRRTLIASYAEWIAKSFWDSRLRPIRSEGPATRLTQRHRSDGRAKPSRVDETTSSRLALCRICGPVRLGANRVCRDCTS